MIRLSIRCQPDQAELVLAELVGISPEGVEERAGEGWVEYSIYGASGELPEIGEVEAACDGGLVEVQATEVAGDWDSRWKDFHHPVTVKSRSGRTALWVGAPWHERPPDGPDIVVIDPGRAFGTGAHPTTRLCLGHLLDLAERGQAEGALLDVGTGSGVLAISGRVLGWDPVLGLDHEVASVEAATANARENSVIAEFSRHDLREGFRTVEATVVANLTAPLLVELARGLPQGKLPVRIVCSGLLREESERVTGSFSSLGFRLTGETTVDGWAGLLFEREEE